MKVFDKFNYAPAIGEDDVAELKTSEAYSRSIGLFKAPVDVDAWVDRALAAEITAAQGAVK